MAYLKLRYVHRHVDRHGKVRHYFRRFGRETRLPGLPGSNEFMRAYQTALEGKLNKPPSAGESQTVPGSLSALIAAWYRSPDYLQLSRSTQTTYRNVVERLREAHGEKPVRSLHSKAVRKLVADKAATPGAANFLLRLIRIIMRFGVEEGWREDNPAIGVRKLRMTSEGFHTWTEEEIAQFERSHPSGTRARLALALLLYTGQRRSDVVRMSQKDLSGDVLAVRQVKTGHSLLVPVHPALRLELDFCNPAHATFLATAAGNPFSAAGFGNAFRSMVDQAGLPQRCCAHGLRKAAARRLAEAGCTTHQIAAVTGHKSLAEVQRYTIKAEQARLAREAMKGLGRVSHG